MLSFSLYATFCYYKLSLANFGFCHVGELSKETLSKAVKRIISGFSHFFCNLAAHYGGLELHEIFQSG